MGILSRIKNRLPKSRSQKISEQVSKLSDNIAGAAVESYKQKYNVHALSSFAGFGGRSNGGKWPGGMSSHVNSLNINHFTSRMNAREIMHDVPQARAIVERFADSVVDIGIKVEPNPDSDILGINPEIAEAWGENVGKRFDLWAKSKKSHRARQVTFYQAQRMYALWQQRDNDILTRLHYSQERDVSNPLQFQFIDPNQLRGYAWTNNFSHFVQSDGISRDARGREVSYKIWVQDEKEGPNKGLHKDIDVPARGSKSGRMFMLHGFTSEYAGQGRGYSRLAHALNDFENITDFTSSQIKKAINQSSIVGWIKPSDDNPASNPFEDLPAGPQSIEIGDSEFTVRNTEALDFCDVPEAATRTPGSMLIANLNEGEELHTYDNTAPSESFEGFVNAFTSYLSSSMGIPLEVVLMKFNQNYSASRAALILFWRVANIWRLEMDSDFIAPIYEMWLSEEIAAGRIQAPGWSDPLLRDAWLSHGLIAAPMPNIDPMKTQKADEGYVAMGATTLDRVARELNGSSGKANRQKITREFSELPENPFKKSTGAAPGNTQNKKNEKSTANATTNDDIMEALDDISDKLLMMED